MKKLFFVILPLIVSGNLLRADLPLEVEGLSKIFRAFEAEITANSQNTEQIDHILRTAQEQINQLLKIIQFKKGARFRELKDTELKAMRLIFEGRKEEALALIEEVVNNKNYEDKEKKLFWELQAPLKYSLFPPNQLKITSMIKGVPYLEILTFEDYETIGGLKTRMGHEKSQQFRYADCYFEKNLKDNYLLKNVRDLCDALTLRVY